MVGSLTGTWIYTYGPGETIAAVMTQNGAVLSGKSSRSKADDMLDELSPSSSSTPSSLPGTPP
jgi:hypothetical protein